MSTSDWPRKYTCFPQYGQFVPGSPSCDVECLQFVSLVDGRCAAVRFLRCRLPFPPSLTLIPMTAPELPFQRRCSLRLLWARMVGALPRPSFPCTRVRIIPPTPLRPLFDLTSESMCPRPAPHLMLSPNHAGPSPPLHALQLPCLPVLGLSLHTRRLRSQSSPESLSLLLLSQLPWAALPHSLSVLLLSMRHVGPLPFALFLTISTPITASSLTC